MDMCVCVYIYINLRGFWLIDETYTHVQQFPGYVMEGRSRSRNIIQMSVYVGLGQEWAKCYLDLYYDYLLGA